LLTTREIALYAEFDPPLLLEFLQRSSFYKLEAAYEVVSAKKLHKETVFLLARMGRARQALRLIVEELGDVREAVQFCVGQADDEIWDDLINYCVLDKQRIATLLDEIGGHLNPLSVIKRIPNDVAIPGLRDKLTRIINDFMVQVNLR
jgi:vacuolar protein sorting-associated protein 41